MAFLLTAGGGLSSTMMSFGLIVVMIVFFYFFVMRPQKKQEKEIREMRDGLQVGDEITTIGGIIGEIISIKEETLMIETGHDEPAGRKEKPAAEGFRLA